MGVHGLWRLIEPAGKPVPLETLDNKVLAVDISIWLHQAVKGFQDSKGGTVPNAHLLGIFHRVCKLLYFRIRPVFVFDGGVPVLKKQTIAKRNQLKSKNITEANRLQKQLISTLLKHHAVNKVIVDSVKTNIENAFKKKDGNNMYDLPSPQVNNESSDEECSSDSSERSSSTKTYDLHTIDEKSSHFKNLPADVRLEILTELKGQRKQNSWGRIHELPTQSDEFSGYQMKRLLKRFSIQTCLEEAEKDLGGASLSLGELETLLNDHGVITAKDMGNRIASDENKRYFLIKDVKKAMDEATKLPNNQNNFENSVKSIDNIDNGDQDVNEKAVHSRENCKNVENSIETSTESNEQPDKGIHEKLKTVADVEYEEDLKKAIQLSLEDTPSTSKSTYERLNAEFSIFNDDSENDSSCNSDDNDAAITFLASAKNYMTEYSGLTPAEISKIINPDSSRENFKKPQAPKINLPKINKLLANDSWDDRVIYKNVLTFSGSNVKESNISSIISNSEPSIDSLKANETSKTNARRYSKINKDEETSNKIVYLLNTPSLNKGGKKLNDVEMSSRSEDKSDLDSSDLIEVSPNEFHNMNTRITKITDNSLDNTLESEKNETAVTFDQNEVELMSDSDSNDDFVEVDSKQNDSCRTNEAEKKDTFEIVIDRNFTMESDDIFSDVFADLKEENNVDHVSNQIKIDAIETQSKSSRIINDIQANLENNSERHVSFVADSTKEISSEKAIETSTLLTEVLNSRKSSNKYISKDELKSIETNLALEKSELISKQSSKERLSTNITEQMCQEAQELLQLFGVPYIVAPMEAEAQCAFLDEINLTDGTITDDSDIWLFGGKTVYKNFFNQTKRVMEFKAENIQHSFKLTRYEMILLALLVGSDYTAGIQGVGPVTALEILANFPPKKQNEIIVSQDQLLSGLREFQKWLNNDRAAQPKRLTLRNKLKNVSLGDHFPSVQVAQAYLEPTVENSNEQFTWGKPDLVSLIDYAKEKFGWDRNKSEGILKPVFKRIEETSTQKKITNYFHTKHKIEVNDTESKISKRVKLALNKIGKGDSMSDEDSKTKEIKNPRESKRKQLKEKETTVKKLNNRISGAKKRKEDGQGVVDEDIKSLQQTKKISRKRAKQIENEMNYALEKQKSLPSTSVSQEVLLSRKLHAKEVIPQKQKDKADLLRTKMKAIEIFRKSKQGPGYVSKRQKKKAEPKNDADLSEDSDS